MMSAVHKSTRLLSLDINSPRYKDLPRIPLAKLACTILHYIMYGKPMPITFFWLDTQDTQVDEARKISAFRLFLKIQYV
jgi:hypothetical protein